MLVVGEAFMDAVPGELESVAGMPEVPGHLVIRSLTKTWGLAGLRIRNLLGSAGLLEQLRSAQPLWAVSTPALAAARACSSSAFPTGKVRNGLRRKGFAVRRGDTFPGLGPDWLRIAVRDPATCEAFADSLREVLT